MNKDHPDFAILSTIREELEALAGIDGFQGRFPELVRSAVDFVLDPVTTARTRVIDLDNVEKTFIGLKLEHFVRDMLNIPKGLRDLRVAGFDVDIKNTVRDNWSIPKETYREDGPCLLMIIDDEACKCSLGLIVAKPAYLHKGIGNRDTKKGVSAQGRKNIMWLIQDFPYPPSRFSELDMAEFRRLRAMSGGSRRAAEFFRQNVGKTIHRSVIQTLLYDQKDPMKRLRFNGGAPDILQYEGIAILIGTYSRDKKIARGLGFVNLGTDEAIAVKPSNDRQRMLLLHENLISPDFNLIE